MTVKIDMYQLTSAENKSSTKRFGRKVHLDGVSRFSKALERLIEKEYTNSHNEIVIVVKQFKSGKHTVKFDLMTSVSLRKDVEKFINSSCPIIH